MSLNLEDPTGSRNARDDYSRNLKRMVGEFNSYLERVTYSYFFEREVSVFAKNIDKSYSSEKLIQSLRTKISIDDKALILKTIRYQMQRGASIALKQSKTALSGVRGVAGQFINKGTLNELYMLNIRHVSNMQMDQIKQLELLLARFIGGGTITWDKLRKGIKKIGGISMAKAEQIARTEIIRAISTTQKEVSLMLGKKRWKWVTANDERVCDICGSLDGKIVEIGKPFVYFRKEPIYNSPVHPNCRCSQEVVK